MSEAKPSENYTWYVVIILTVVNVFSYMDRTALSVLLPAIKKDLALSDTESGMLIGLSFFIFYALCGIPIARWADRGVRVNIIVVTLSIWSVMTAITGLTNNFFQLLLARAGLGAGEAGCIPAAESLIADYVVEERRAGAYAVHAFGYSAGAMVGLIAAGQLGDLIGWRWTFVVLGLPGLLLASLIFLTLREPLRGGADRLCTQVAPLPTPQAVKVLLANKTYRGLVAYLTINAFAYAGLWQWWPSFYVRNFGQSMASVGLFLGVAIGIGSAAGAIAGGIIFQRLSKKSPATALVGCAASTALIIPFGIASIFVSSPTVSMALALVTTLLWTAPSGAVTAAYINATHPSARATASAFNVLCMSLFGFGLGPLCVGALSDHLSSGLGAMSLKFALLLPLSVLVGVTACLLMVARTLVSKSPRAAPLGAL